MRYLVTLLLIWPCFVIGQTHTGGIQSMRSPYLHLANQDIHLSVDQVKVTYTYFNTAPNEITETLVFTLPIKNEENSRQFAIAVNQTPIAYQILQHAISPSGHDITKDIKALGLPLNPIAAIHSIDASPNRDSIISRLRSLNLIDKHEDIPNWTVQTYYFWQQTFPANSKVVIEQTYKPNIQSKSVKLNSFTSLLKLPVKIVKRMVNIAIHWSLEDETALTNLQEQFEKYWPNIQNYCPTKHDYFALVQAYKQHPSKKPMIELKELHFAYGTNELWANPINNFTMTIDAPKNMYPILCWNDNLKRANSNSLQFSAQNYIPLQNIAVLFIEK